MDLVWFGNWIGGWGISFAHETVGKYLESSVRLAKESVKKLGIGEANSSHEACSSRVYNEDIQGLELTSENRIGTEPVITVDKGVRKHTNTKSVCTQCNPLYVWNKLQTTETCKNDLKVK